MSADDLSAIDAIVGESLRQRLQPQSAGPQTNGERERSASEQAEPGEADEGSTSSLASSGPPVGVQRPVLDLLGASPVDTGQVDGNLAELIAERDSYLADSQRLAADFANYRKQTDKRVADSAAAMAAGLVRNLLPVIDACDSALEQDPESGVAPIRATLLSELEKSGLELLAPGADTAFDPELHEAVMHEAAASDETSDGPTVAEVFRAGYLWKGKVVRPAMVKVVGE